jgi:CubicO group peptidase (beta-lactamase class C family)
MKWPLTVVFLSLLAPSPLAAQQKEENLKPAQSILELQKQLDKILKDTHTPGLSVAIVHRDGPEWVAGLGTADVASGRVATPDTLFRAGSVSKAFASLAILMLVDQGKLSLDDPVRKLAPEVWFENPWETMDPVRVVHLLEHTTGWDDLHFREVAKDWPDTMGMRQALDYDHRSRVSSWRPGTRFWYCSSGPTVAAYIVEKISGQRFEDFVEQNLFRPIGMKTATYFKPADTAIATLYHDDGKSPYPYWNIICRPAGAMNASAKDMAAYLQFYLNRGAVNGKQLVPSADIDRMEIPASTWAAKDGMKYGYGLGNYWTVEDGFVYHGHVGSVVGGSSELEYLPDYGVGYFFGFNTGNGDAYDRIGKAIRDYITRNLQRPALPVAASLLPRSAEHAGWYELETPRGEVMHFLFRLGGLGWIRFKDGRLIFSAPGVGMWNDTFVPVTGMQFRHVKKDEMPDPVPTLVLLTPNEEGRFIDVGVAMRKIPGWFAFGEILTVAYVAVCMASIVVYAPFWILGGLWKQRRRPAERGMRTWPLLAVLSLAAFMGVYMWINDDMIVQLGNLTVWSAALFLLTITFAVAAVMSAILWWRTPAKAVRPSVRRFSLIVTIALLITAAYLGYWGIIGLRTWS